MALIRASSPIPLSAYDGKVYSAGYVSDGWVVRAEHRQPAAGLGDHLRGALQQGRQVVDRSMRKARCGRQTLADHALASDMAMSASSPVMRSTAAWHPSRL